MAYPEWINGTERQIIDKLIETILGAGYLIRVYDGEEWAMDAPTKDVEAITAEVAATDVTVFHVYSAAPQRIGAYVLIHGNDADVVSDWSWRTAIEGSEAIMDRLAAPAQELADTL